MDLWITARQMIQPTEFAWKKLKTWVNIVSCRADTQSAREQLLLRSTLTFLRLCEIEVLR